METINIIEIKRRIENLINDNYCKEAIKLLEKLLVTFPDDIEIYSMYVVALSMLGNFNEAIAICMKGLDVELDNFDLNYNLACIYEGIGEYSKALTFYALAIEECKDLELRENIDLIIKNIQSKKDYRPQQKIAFFVKVGMDSFLNDIINGLSEEYIVKKIIVTNYNQIDKGMEWADICWFEWCDELIEYGSKHRLATERKIICRLHRYEVFTYYPKNVEWNNVDKLIVVTEHLKEILNSQIPDLNERVNIITINNGVNLEKFQLKERKSGFKLAYVGYIHQRKNPVLLLQIISKLVKKDKRYKLYVAGEFQEDIIELYWNYQIQQMNLQDNVIFEGWQGDINGWLEDKNYILSSSIHESFGYGIAEAMARGIKPVIHNFIFAEEIWNRGSLFNTIDEAVNIITEKKYNSIEYRKFIENNFSLENQMKSIKRLISGDENVKSLDIIMKKYYKGVFGENKIKDITLLVCTYNRSKVLLKDLRKNYKFENVNKIIVDDCSTTDNIKMLQNSTDINDVQTIIYSDINKGIAGSIKEGVKHINTKYMSFCGDDDIIICNEEKNIISDMNLLDDDYAVVIPRYVINLDTSEKLDIGYDRVRYKDLTAAQTLQKFFETGEMEAFMAGTIVNTKYVKGHMAESMFRVSEDYVIMTRVLAQNLNKKIMVSENYAYIRRISSDTLSKTLDTTKLAIHSLSLLIAAYYCVEGNIVSSEDVMNIIYKRCNLLNNIYGFGMDIYKIIDNYLRDKIDKSEFIEILKNDYKISMEEYPKEFELLKARIPYI
ncbi:glycosyltransferase [Clostridium sp. CTA-7]